MPLEYIAVALLFGAFRSLSHPQSTRQQYTGDGLISFIATGYMFPKSFKMLTMELHQFAHMVGYFPPTTGTRYNLPPSLANSRSCMSINGSINQRLLISRPRPSQVTVSVNKLLYEIDGNLSLHLLKVTPSLRSNKISPSPPSRFPLASKASKIAKPWTDCSVSLRPPPHCE